jgi:predicted RNase H-like nuclease (RuvC/YqgF family)
VEKGNENHKKTYPSIILGKKSKIIQSYLPINQNDQESSPKKSRKRKELTYDQYYKRINDNLASATRWKDKFNRKCDEVEHLEETCAKLKRELCSVQKLAEEREEVIDKLQQERLDTLRGSEHSVTPDDIVTSQLGGRFQESREWSRKWGLDEWSFGDEEKRSQVVGVLKAVAPQADYSKETARAIKRGSIPPSVVLNTIVNMLLSVETIGDPFRFLRSDQNGHYNPRFDQVGLLLGELMSGKKAPTH